MITWLLVFEPVVRQSTMVVGVCGRQEAEGEEWTEGQV
jgi:hypothetical protein